MPNGVFPVVGSFIFLDNELAVYLNAKSGKLGKLDVSVDEFEVVLIGNVVEDALAHVIVNTYALLLNDGVIAGSVYVEAGGEGDRSERTVGR